MKTDVLQVKRTGDFYYPIYFEDNFDGLADALRKENLDGRSICIVTDTNVAPLYAEQVQKVLTPVASHICTFTFEAGEQSKHLGIGIFCEHSVTVLLIQILAGVFVYFLLAGLYLWNEEKKYICQILKIRAS